MAQPLHLSAQLVRDAIPKFNPVIANGVATEHFKELEEYIHQILKDGSAYFPTGLKYVGYRRATPEEEMRFVLEKKANSKHSHWTVEVAKTTTYLMIYTFEFEGAQINHEVYLPFLCKGAQMWSRGTAYTIIPILTAPVFSVESLKQQVFLKLLSNKLTFNRFNYTVLVDGIDSVLSIVHSKIHRINPKDQAHYESKKDESVNMNHATALYMFCEYGVKEAFSRYGKSDILLSQGEYDFEGNGLNREDWVIYSSKKRKPASVKLKVYTPHDVQLAIPKSSAEDTMVIGLAAGFMYIADNYSLFMSNIEEFDDPSFWRIILGKMCLKTNDNVSKLLSEANRHMNNVRRMLDAQQRTDLRRADLYVDDMIDLLAYIIGNYPKILREEESGSLYGKRLLILRNVLEDIIIGINMLTFKGGTKKAVTERTIKQEIAKNLSSDRILAIKNSSCTEMILSPSDNMMFKHTCKFLLQNNISKSKDKKGGDVNTNDPDKYFHPSILEIGSYQAIKDSEPTGRQLLNPYQMTSTSGITKQNPELQDTIAYLDYHTVRD